MKVTSVYRNPAYLVSYGTDDVIHLNTEVHIHKDGTSLSFDIVRCTISDKENDFTKHLYGQLDAPTKEMVDSMFRTLLTQDIEPQLFSLWHTGEVNPHGNSPKID